MLRSFSEWVGRGGVGEGGREGGRVSGGRMRMDSVFFSYFFFCILLLCCTYEKDHFVREILGDGMRCQKSTILKEESEKICIEIPR